MICICCEKEMIYLGNGVYYCDNCGQITEEMRTEYETD